MLRALIYDAIWINELAPAFPTAALRKVREGRATHSFRDAEGQSLGHPSTLGVGDLGKIKSPGPPAKRLPTPV